MYSFTVLRSKPDKKAIVIMHEARRTNNVFTEQIASLFVQSNSKYVIVIGALVMTLLVQLYVIDARKCQSRLP